MSSWTSPITWSSGSVVTAAQMNTEIKNHLNFLKGALDLLTNSSTADTGDTMTLQILRAASTDAVFQAAVTGDAANRFALVASGKMEWGSGAGGRDTNLYRSSADNLMTDDALNVGSASQVIIDPNGWIDLGERADPGVSAANRCRLYTKDNGAGKTLLVVVFSSGAVQTIATQP